MIDSKTPFTDKISMKTQIGDCKATKFQRIQTMALVNCTIIKIC